jgi:hypothetical protein
VQFDSFLRCCNEVQCDVGSNAVFMHIQRSEIPGILTLWRTRRAPWRFTIRPPVPIATVPFGPAVAISPDARHIALIGDEGKTRLWILHLDQEQPQAIEGTEGVLGAFWSPDNKYVAFATAGALKTVPVSGSLTVRTCDLPTSSYYPAGATLYGATFYGGAWSSDGLSIVFSTGDPAIVYEVSAAGGSARVLLSAELLKRLQDTSATRSSWPVKTGPRTRRRASLDHKNGRPRKAAALSFAVIPQKHAYIDRESRYRPPFILSRL